MLIGNGTVVNKHPGRVFTSPAIWQGNQKTGALRGRFYGATNSSATNASSDGFEKKDGSPTGYRPPYSWLMAQTDGGLGSTNIIAGLGLITSFNLAGGMGASAGCTGFGTINYAQGSLIVKGLSTILGTGSIYYAALVGDGLVTSGLTGYGTINSAAAGAITGIQAVAGLTGYGYIVGQLGALAGTLAGLTGFGTINLGNENAYGSISADIVPYTVLSPQNLAAAVWSALSVDFNEAPTMGGKLNSAGNAGDPWSTTLPGSYTADQAGAIVDRLEDLINQVKTLTAAQS